MMTIIANPGQSRETRKLLEVLGLLQRCSDFQIRTRVISISLREPAVNPAALCSDQNLSFAIWQIG